MSIRARVNAIVALSKLLNIARKRWFFARRCHAVSALAGNCEQALYWQGEAHGWYVYVRKYHEEIYRLERPEYEHRK